MIFKRTTLSVYSSTSPIFALSKFKRSMSGRFMYDCVLKIRSTILGNFELSMQNLTVYLLKAGVRYDANGPKYSIRLTDTKRFHVFINFSKQALRINLSKLSNYLLEVCYMVYFSENLIFWNYCQCQEKNKFNSMQSCRAILFYSSSNQLYVRWISLWKVLKDMEWVYRKPRNQKSVILVPFILTFFESFFYMS